MFDIFHGIGWNNGPECKKLIMKLQCRLKIFKNNRGFKANQLHEDISQLLHHGLAHHAFDKVEKLFKNELEVIIYDLLDNFCEFMINFSYISEYKDFSNEMDQAVSSLIFSSSRLRDLPELIQIRKLFRKLYGERFAKVALDSLPGNLVNQQIKDCFSIISESVSDETKLRLMNEIARNCLNSGPLVLDHPEAESSREGVEGETWSLDVNADSVEFLIVEKEEMELEFEDHFDFSDCEFINLVPRTSSTPFKDRIDGVEEIGYSMVEGYSSESSAAFLDEIKYSDDIEEHESAARIEWNIKDQRVFKFPLSSSGDEYRKDHFEKRHLKRKSRRKLRKRSISAEKGFMNDSDSAYYYGVSSYETSPNRDRVNWEPELKRFEQCSEEYPCYLCKTERVDYLIYQYLERLSPEEKEEFIQEGLICMRALSLASERLEKYDFMESLPSKSRRKLMKRSISVEKGCMVDSETAIYYGVDSYETSLNKNHVNEESNCKEFGKCSATDPCYLCKSGVDYLIYQSFESLSPEEREEFIEDGLICMRALSMPPERLEKYDLLRSTSSISESESFPVTTSTCHVHPKLPDYDDLSTRFIALKQAYLGCKA